ncbi:MAG: hypothetical protein PVG66_09135 [Chromatiales bacterium]|jgi:hypothetical protein
MKIMVATEADVEAQVYAPVVDELLRRGHEVHVFSRYRNVRTFNIEFELRGIPIRHLDEFHQVDEHFDVALVYREVLGAVQQRNIPMVYTLFGPHSSEHRVIAAQYHNVDLMLVPSRQDEINLRRSGFVGEVLVTGSPKFDPLFRQAISNDKLIVVFDAPNKPRGDDRKRFFNLLCELARRNPDYRVLIKPRFLLGERWEQSDFLVGYDKHMAFYQKETPDCPANLEVLDEYRSPNDLCARASLAIGTPTSALFTQMVLHKPALVIQNSVAPNDIIHDGMYRSNQEVFQQSGCSIWLDELLDYAPAGLQPHTEWIERQIGPYDGQASARVVDALEQVAANSRQGISWLPQNRSSMQSFATDMQHFRQQHAGWSEAECRQQKQQAHALKVSQGIEAVRCMAQDLVPDLNLEQELETYRQLLVRLDDVVLDDSNMNRAYAFFHRELHRLANKLWNLRINLGFFRNNVATGQSVLAHDISMHLHESGGQGVDQWQQSIAPLFGYSWFNYFSSDLSRKSDGDCTNLLQMFWQDGQKKLAALYACELLKRGKTDIPDDVLDYLQSNPDHCADVSNEAVKRI